MSSLGVIILAAGKGTRMKSEMPKVLHEVCGRPIIHYVLDVARKVNSEKICVVLGHGIEKVRALLPADIITVEQKALLGTGDAVRTAEKFFKQKSGEVLILCGDTPLLQAETIKALIRQHRKSKAACTVLTAVVDNSRSYGRMIRDNTGSVVAIREEADANDDERQVKEINVGVYCFQAKALFDNLKTIKPNQVKGEYYLTDLVKLFAEKGLKLATLTTPEPSEGWGINTRVDLAACAHILRQRVLKTLMLSGVTIVDRDTTYIAADAKIGTDTVIRPMTVIENDVVIGKNCLIGPFARVRPGTRIGNHIEVGNFAEISRSSVGDKTLMRHFSYLGDSRVGKNVNIGAGTVTANFDGKNKNQTVIEDDAFIGSDTIMVAPVTVKKKAMTGAGSVITAGKIVPAGKIFAGVPARLVPGRKESRL